MKLLLTSFLASALLAGPALAQPSVPRPAPPSGDAVYRLDFELSTSEPGKPATTTRFSLNLREHDPGEAMIGDNLALPGSGGPNGAPVRQNVGVKVHALCEQRGAALLVDVDTQLSSMVAPATMHEIVTRDVALAAFGKKTLVSSVDHDGARTQLFVTPARL